ncbi:CocE/NonD family hydrolase [Castellaniella sp. FW104-16D08]|jgi:alpha/beta superfamily hydrolase|uniref:alpha/beta hydrolase n=1 Tax=unclassified Castellaniella TaxID=2617606 RepID=UPI0033164650
MGLRTQQAAFQGMSGTVEYTVDHPEQSPVGWALVLHPHPLHGGTRDNKVVTTVARTCVQRGLLTIRPNFRGVGGSEGVFDHAVGETRDMVACVEHVRQTWPQACAGPWALAGFSFGSAVAAQLYAELADLDVPLPRRLMLIGCAVERFRYRALSLPPDVLMIHGEQDEVVPVSEALDFARTHQLPLTLVPDASHFFHGRLLILRQIVLQGLAGLREAPDTSA